MQGEKMYVPTIGRLELVGCCADSLEAAQKNFQRFKNSLGSAILEGEYTCLEFVETSQISENFQGKKVLYVPVCEDRVYWEKCSFSEGSALWKLGKNQRSIFYRIFIEC